MHPKYEVRKIYHVFLDKPVEEADLEKLIKGIELEDGPINADEVSFVDGRDHKQVGVVIHSGRNRSAGRPRLWACSFPRSSTSISLCRLRLATKLRIAGQRAGRIRAMETPEKPPMRKSE